MLSEPQQPVPSGCALALLAAGVVAEPGHADRLTRREAEHLSGLGHPRVRRRWLAGRLAAKSLLLSGRTGLDVLDVLDVLDGESLRAFPAARYREIELLPAATGAPRLTRHGREVPARVSISHGGGLSCAALAAADAATGIDLETVAPRVEAFYRGNFTPGERRWAEDGARATALSRDWLYTFLWTLKEAAFKSGATAVEGVWGFAGLEIRLPAGLAERLEASRRPALGERFAVFETLVCAAQRRTLARIETTSTPDVVLSLFTAGASR
ncbi:MAG TPA: 4'-phosphopantetheinyl transferase superfamily protein [Thermoanaerobaculia bacterium]|jgi:phosphopantetheinyl transferase|nr:4'-phosphopantetheinyl transferase superfamily protein [Thermoanaerobaculia bacterium]